MQFVKKFLIFLSFSTICQSVFALSLNEYLSQVKQENVGYKSNKIDANSSDVLSKKSSLLTTPNLFIDAKTGYEKQNQASSFVRYSQVNTENYSAGIEQNFAFGLRSKFYYNLNRTYYDDLTSGNSLPDSTSTNPVVSLEIPLWQDLFGASLRANKDSVYQLAQAKRFNSEYTAKTFEVDSEKSYWALVSAKDIVEIVSESLKRSQDLLDNAERKNRMNLGEKADVLQAKADFESRKLQLQQAENQAKIAARAFNQKRFLNSDIVDEKLEEIDFKYLESLQIDNTMPDDRSDIKAQSATSKALVAQAKIEEESNKPTLNLYGSYGYNGLEITRQAAINKSFAEQGNEGYIGVKFSMPIAIGLQSDIRDAARANATSARMSYHQKVLNQETDWQNLLQNLNDYAENLRLARKVEELQKSKLANERNLLKSGRSSTYQVILFEQDYNQSRITTIQTANQLLGLLAEKKFYQN